MVNEVIHIKESDLTPEEKKSIGIEDKPKEETEKKENFFRRLTRRVKCSLCGRTTSSKSGICRKCQRQRKNRFRKQIDEM